MNPVHRAIFLPLLCFGFLLAAGFSLKAQDEEARLVDGLSLPHRLVTVSSPVQEIIAEVFVEEGDRVEEGQVLTQLLSERDEIELRRYKKLLEKRQFDNQASQNLLEQNLLSKEKALAAEAELELAQVDYDLARVTLEEKSVRAPLDGIVIRRLIEPGESVDRLAPLFDIVNTDKLQLQFYLEPKYLVDLQLGDEIVFFVSETADVRGTATVEFISPSADPQSGLFRVKLLTDNSDGRFLAGVRVTGEF